MSAKQVMTEREALERFKETHPELGSARKIAEMPESDFVETYADTFPDGKRQARRVHKTAFAINEKTALIWANIKDAVASPYFSGALFNNIPQEFIKHQQSIPGYDRLFGNLDFIECDHCRSIFGPAAYFVDLMRFVETNVTNNIKDNDIPHDLQLESRRPDLPRIRLDCHNSHDLIPYIDLVNETLETIIRTSQTPDAYRVVEESDYPMNLPFNLPLAEIRGYLKQLKTSLHQVYQTFEISPGDKKNPITREFLELSPKEFSLIICEISRPEQLSGYYGLDVTVIGHDGLENVNNFLAQTGLDRRELNDLIYQDLDQHEVNAGLARLFFINNVGDGLGHLVIEVDDGNPDHPYEKLANLSYKKLDRIYRFLKLARKLDWSFAELDYALRSLNESFEPEKALKFDGSNDYVAAHNVNGLDLRQLTIEAWVNPTRHKKNPILAKGRADDHKTHFLFWVDAEGRLALYGDDVKGEDIEVRSVHALNPGVFSHVAVTVDSKEVRFYINGRLDNSRTLNKPLAPTGGDLEIGRNLNDSYFEGIIKEVRVWDEARGQASIEANRYRRFTGRENHLVGYWPLTELRWNQLPDLSDNHNDLVLGGEEFVTQPTWVYRDLVLDPAPEPLDGRACQFDGRDQYLAARPVQGLDPNQFTLEAWVTLDEYRENNIIAMGNEANGSTDFQLFVDGSGRLNFKNSYFDVTFGGPIPGQTCLVLHEATHVAVTLVSNSLNLFVNGALDRNHWSEDQSALRWQGDTLSVGRNFSGEYIKGQLSEIRFWNHARSQDEIVTFMHRSLSGGEPGLIGYWPLRTEAEDDGLVCDRSSNGNHLYLGGVPGDYMPDRVDTDLLLPEQPIAAEAKVLQLDGDNDVITIRNPDNTGLGQYERLTLAFWFKADDISLAREQILLSQGDGEAGLSVYLKDSRLLVLAWNTNYELSSVQEAVLTSDKIRSATWHHLAVVNDESVALDAMIFKAYLDGKEIGPKDGFRLCPVGPIYLGGIGEDGVTRFQDGYVRSDTRYLHYFAGQMAYFRLWQEIKTAADIDRERLAAPDGTATDLVAYLPLDEGEGRLLFDKSGNEHHGHLQENNMALTNDGSAELANIYSHYGEPEALLWTNYIYSGRLYLTDPEGGIGVTIFSRHLENQDYCYVLRRDQANPTYHLDAHPQSIRKIDGQLESGVNPEANTWYRFRLQAEYDGTLTRIRAKVWPDGDDEPADFQIDASDASRLRLTGGTIGFWATGPGAKYADDLRVRLVSGDAPEPAADLLAENFEAYTDGSDADDWRDTAVEWVREPDDGRFKTIELDGDMAFGIEGEHSDLEEVHTHYDDAQALAWKDYIFTGGFRLAGEDDPFGLTFYSGYPEGRDEYYRIRRTWDQSAFYLDSRPRGRQPLTGQLDSGVAPVPDTWYRFHIEVEDRDDRTIIRAKIWPFGDDQPETFQIDACDDGPQRLTSGTVGLWSLGSGDRVVDDLLVDHLAGRAPWPSMTLLLEDFQSYEVQENPTGWKNTKANNSSKEDNKLFRTTEFEGARVFWTEVKQHNSKLHDNIHSHYVAPGVLDWTNYVFSGRLYITESDGGTGVTFFSQYPKIWQDDATGYNRYYCLHRHEEKETFHLSSDLATPPSGEAKLGGTTDSGVQPVKKSWYRFLVEVEDSGGRTNIRAKVWQEGTAEPADFQIDAYDDSQERLTSGTVGVWNDGPGSKLFVDFKVVHQPLLFEDFDKVDAGQSPEHWTETVIRSIHEEDAGLFKAVDVKNNTPRWWPVVDYPLLPRPLNRRALQFDGRRKYAAAVMKGLGLDAFTLEAWVYPIALDYRQPIFTLAGAQSKLLFGLGYGGHLLLELNGEPVLRGTAALEPGAFTHVALAVTGETATIYVNGQVETTKTLPASVKLEDGLLEIGHDPSGNYFEGQLKEVRLWNIAQDTARIEAGRYQRPYETSAVLAGCWTFDEAEGVLARDTSGATNHWWLGGLEKARWPTLFQPQPSPDDTTELRPDQVLAFAEQADFLYLPDMRDTDAGPRQRRTVELWFKVEDKNLSHRKQILYQEGNDRRGLVFYVYDGALYFGGYNSIEEESNWAGTWFSTGRIESGKWHHAALVLDGRQEMRDDSLQAYLDGKLADAGRGSQLWPGGGGVSLGGATGPGRFHDDDDQPAALDGHYLAGQVMELRLWDTARTPAEIKATWRHQLPGPLPHLALWWQFDDLDGLRIPDRSGNGRDGTVRHQEQIQPADLPATYRLPQVALDKTTIGHIADIKRLKQTHNLSIDKLCALWYSIKASGKADQVTLYDRVFNPKGVVIDHWDYHLDEPIRWDVTGETNRDRDRKIRSRLMGALRVSSDDLNRIVKKLSGDETLVELDNTYLTRLYRLARVSGILRLTVPEFFRLLELAGLKEIDSIQAFLQLTQQTAWMKKTGIDVYELDFLANDRQSKQAAVAYSEAAIRDLADGLSRQSADFLARPEAFVSDDISEHQSRDTFEFLCKIGFIDADGAVTAEYNVATDLAPLANDQEWAAGFEDLGNGVFEKLKQGGFIDDNGLVLKSDEEVLRDVSLQTLFTGEPKPSLETLAKIRDTLIRRQKAQDKIGTTLVRMREEHAAAVLVGLSTLFGTAPELMQEVTDHFEFEMDARQFLHLMMAFREEDPIPDEITEYLYKLNKVLYLVAQFALSPAETASLLQNPDHFHVKNVLNPGVEDLDSLFTYTQLRDAFGDGDGNLIRLLGRAQEDTAGLLEDIRALTDWERRQIQSLSDYLGCGERDNHLATLNRFKGCFDLAQAMGVDVDFLISLSDTRDLSYDFYKKQSAVLLAVLRAGYDDEKWVKVFKPIRDQLAVQKRDALLSRAMMALGPDYEGRKDPDVLYEFLLLDVQMGSETETSRIVQATASLQLYVQRCLMNLEKGVKPESIPADQWQWMKNYRVWEANRKVFLYPENYIEPELRDNKSPLFEQLEQELMQEEIDRVSVERAYINYLDRFKEIADLKIVGSYYHAEPDDEADNILYLVGRTTTEPKNYYYRELVNGERWLPWKKIEIGIQSDFATPVFVFNKLFLFWVEFTKLVESVDIKATPKDIKDGKLKDKDGYLVSKIDTTVRLKENRDIYKAIVKYSYYNFSKSWTQPQTYQELERDLSLFDHLQPKWQRVYAQRSLNFYDEDQLATASSSPTPVVEKETNAMVLAIDEDTRIARYIPPADMNELTWSFWVRFINANPAGSVATIEAQPLVLVDYAGGLKATVTNNVTPIPGAAEALAAAEAEAERLKTEANTVEAEAKRQETAADEAEAEAKRLEMATDEAEAKSKANPEDTALAKAATDAREAANRARQAATGARGAAITKKGAYDTAQQAADDAAAALKTIPQFESKDLTIVFTIGDQDKTVEMTLKYDDWQHVALTLEYVYNKSEYRANLYKNGLLKGEKEIPTRRLPAQEQLVVARMEQQSQSSFASQMSEFRLWDRARNQETIEAEMDERKSDAERDLLVHLPLNQDEENSVESSLTFRIVKPPVLIPVPMESRERLILFYGDQYRSVRDTMQDYNFSLQLQSKTPPGNLNYDLDLSLTRLQITLTEALSINDYATDGNSTLNRFTPDVFRSTGFFRDIFKSFSSLFRTFEEDNYLLKDLSRMEATLFDVNNQPGWYLLDTGEEQFLVTADVDGLQTATDRLKFDVPTDATPGQPPIAPITMYFDIDPKLKVEYETGVPKFHLERLSTSAVNALSLRLFARGLDGLLTVEAQQEKEWDFSKYEANTNLVLNVPPDTIDFDGAYGLYYREIFFHIPFFIANQLNANQKFADAQRWYHFLFDPTAQEGNGQTPDNPKDRYWRYLPFRDLKLGSLEEMLANREALAEYREDPFAPHAIARLRVNAYQKAIVMKYIDNLLDWGDYLFSQDTRESIGEAVPLYVLAYNLLGPRPEARLARKFEEVGSYRDIRQEYGPEVPEFLAEVEKVIDVVAGSGRLPANPHSHIVTKFCVIENELFMGYWDRVTDRLYKIRHSLNIEGVFRSLALFDPPLDPMALVRAASGGRDLSSALSDLSVPVPHYRYSFMLERAKEMTGSVIDLGAKLLGALESRDAEKLAVLQNTHEKQLLSLLTAVKKSEKAIIDETIEALGFSRLSVVERQSRYKTLVDEGVSDLEKAAAGLLGLVGVAKVAVGIMNMHGQNMDALGSFIIGTSGAGGSPVVQRQLEGKHLAANILATSELIDKSADATAIMAYGIAKAGENQRRKAEWEYEIKIADHDLNEIDRQIAIARLQLSIASQELTIHDKTIQQNQEIADFYRDKFSTADLYNWMIGRLSGLYFQAYKLAYDMAKSAEKALQFELPTNQSYISFGHWDSLKKGLLAGESLLLELNRMEKSHLDQDSRFMEIEKVISMKREMPLELALLKAQGECDFHLSERLYNRDFPGHYCRLIKTIAISVKAKVDPYDSVNATLIQLGNRTLLEPNIGAVRYLMGVDGAEQPDSGVIRSNWRANQRIAISKPDEDAGMFTLDFFKDDRYFPFEGTGAVSYWRLEMPQETNGLELSTIEDIIIHLRYTSKSDHATFRNEVKTEMKAETES